jgi:cytochrome c peroxidase
MSFPVVSGMFRSRRRVVAFALLFAVFAACSKDESDTVVPPTAECPAAQPLTLTLPTYFPEMPSRADNPLTVEGVALGRRLFHDPILSGDSSLACAGCHTQSLAFGDFRPASEGIHGDKSTRQAPTIVNQAWNINGIFWDGRAADLEEQATRPVPEVTEMDLPWPTAVERLQRHPDYPDLFCAAFGTSEITRDRVVKAIGQFERTFISVNSKYDKWRRGEVQLSYEEYRGYLFFMAETKGDCFHCHAEPLFTSADFRVTGLDSIPLDLGRGAISGNPVEIGAFKAPTLRNIMESPPYMHDGRFMTIRQVLEHYNHGFSQPGNLDPLIDKRNQFPPMSAADLDTLEFFLHTLTDWEFLGNPDLSDPFATSAPVANSKPRAR